jgi:hypothetical protein
MFQLSAKELAAWRSHFVMSNPGAKMGLRRAPFAFTEHGALMAFLAAHKDLARRLEEHEKKLSSHDQAIAGLVNSIRSLMAPPEPPRRRPIGFVTPDEKKRS